MKNSWGTNFGEDGFFYISYYDPMVGDTNWVGVGTEPVDNYKAVYQYDPLGLCNTYGFNSETIWFANKFTASSTSSISAVGWYVMSPSSTYEISIYTDPTSGPVYGGSLKLKQTGTAANPGYNTIKLTSPVSVTNGHKFTVVVKTTTPGNIYPMPMEYPISQYSSKASAEPDQSFTSDNGQNWYDLDYYDANACLKAYAASDVATVVTPTFSPDGGTYNAAQSVTISCATSGATIHYTIDGVDPTQNDPTISSGAKVTVSKSLILKAKAWKTGMNPSAVKSASYIIQQSHKPTNDSLTPSSSSLRGYWKYTFTSTHSDSLGASTITSARLLINTSKSGVNAIYCLYSGNKLYLANDEGTKALGGYGPGSEKVIENSQCKLNCKDTTVSMSGNTLTVNWSLIIKPSMAIANEPCSAWLYVSDSSKLSQGWDKAGDFDFRPLDEPWNVSLIPVSGTLDTETQYTISSVYFDSACCSSMATAAILINNKYSVSNAAYCWYDVQANKLYLRNNNNTGSLGGYAPGSNKTIENSQCKLYCKNTSVTKTTNGLTINWRIEFKSSMSGKSCNGWLYIRDTSGVSNGWDQMGGYTIE